MKSNDSADLHYLAEEDTIFIQSRLDEINKRINEIVEKHGLKGHWTISSDLKWLIQQEK